MRVGLEIEGPYQIGHRYEGAAHYRIGVVTFHMMIAEAVAVVDKQIQPLDACMGIIEIDRKVLGTAAYSSRWRIVRVKDDGIVFESSFFLVEHVILQQTRHHLIAFTHV